MVSSPSSDFLSIDLLHHHPVMRYQFLSPTFYWVYPIFTEVIFFGSAPPLQLLGFIDFQVKESYGAKEILCNFGMHPFYFIDPDQIKIRR
jgi:hypothetical protein